MRKPDNYGAGRGKGWLPSNHGLGIPALVNNHAAAAKAILYKLKAAGVYSL